MVTPTGFEPVLPPWKGGVLTAWPRGHFIIMKRYLAESKGFEPLRQCYPPTRFPIVLLRPLGQLSKNGSEGRTRTYDRSVNSRLLYHWATSEYYYAQRRPTLAGGDPQLPSAMKSLTSVFGMGTGVTSSPSSLDILILKDNFYYIMYASILQVLFHKNLFVLSKLDKRHITNNILFWLSPRSISIRQLHVSPRFHPEPIYLIVFEGSYLLA